MTPNPHDDFVELNLEAVRNEFEANFLEGLEVGAALSIWKDGCEVLSLAGGVTERNGNTPWQPDSPVLCWSATKGPAACTTLLAMHKGGIALTDRVAWLWPDFAAKGKGEVTYQELLSHSAGLTALDDPGFSMLDHAAVAEALAAQTPHWQPGRTHGYHPRTLGYLMDEIVRRLAGGKTLGECWREWIADPCEIDFWIGVPDTITVNPILAPRSPEVPEQETAFYRALADPTSLQARSFATPGGSIRPSQMNQLEFRSACLPAFGGIGSAEGLGRFYAMLAQGGRWAGEEIVPPRICGQLSSPVVDGFDEVLMIPTAYSCGMMVPRRDGGAKHFPAIAGTCGHAGAGGCLGFAIPSLGIAFAYVPNQMELGILPGPRTTRLVQALLHG